MEQFSWLEVGGLSSAVKGMRFPTKSTGDSRYDYEDGFVLGDKDKKLARHLISKGSVHGKFQRGIIAWFDINMPRYIWSELDTYTVGVSPTSSESTMYTLLKESRKINRTMFSSSTPKHCVGDFRASIEKLESFYGNMSDIPIEAIKACLPEGWMQRRIKAFSYQALKGIYTYRKNHRLPEWQLICRQIEHLPYFEDLIIGCNKEDFKFDGEE